MENLEKEALDKLTRDDLAEAIMAETGLKKNKAMNVLNAVIGRMVAGLREGRDVEIRGLGTFHVTCNKMRNGVSNLGLMMNPELLDENARKYGVKFKAGKGLRWIVKG